MFVEFQSRDKKKKKRSVVTKKNTRIYRVLRERGKILEIASIVTRGASIFIDVRFRINKLIIIIESFSRRRKISITLLTNEILSRTILRLYVK